MSKKVKVGVVINSIDKYGGIGKIAIEQVKALNKLNYNAELVVFQGDSQSDVYSSQIELVPICFLEKRITKLLRLNITVPFFTFLNFAHFINPFLLIGTVKYKEWDILINHETYILPFMVLLKRHKDIAFINYVWDPAQYIYNKVYSNSFHYMINRIMRSLLKKVDQYFLERADDIILGGAAHKKYIEMFSSDFLICMPSVNIDEHACCLLDKAFYSEPYIFVMTAWKEGKNPEFLIDLTKKIPNLVIYMGGMWIDRVDKDRFKQILIEREACENIKILGTLSESELNYYYKNARAVLQTNDDRGFGMSALEGAANCTPFIIPEDQGVCDLFVNGEHGFFTKQYDINKICELIELFINDAEYSIMLGKKAFTNVKKYYTWDHHAKIISERITKCLS